ncbi:MAG: DinB family protein [Bryobacteraceae bacterium]
MLISREVLAHHIAYTRWASVRLVEAAGALSFDELTRDFQTADKSVLGTLVHIFAADRVWMARIRGDVPGPFVDATKDMHLSVLQNEWPALLEQWADWVAGLSEVAITANIPYNDLRGNPYQTPAWQILLHMVNHGTHHRGQVSGFLRAMGHKPPVLDLIAYYRSL